MSRPAIVVLGILTLWPLLYAMAFFGFVVYTKIQTSVRNAAVEEILHLTTASLVFGVWIVYLIDFWRSDRIPDEKKAMWASLLILGGILAMPAYWYLYLWRLPSTQPR